MSFESATEFARWTLSFVATQIRRRRFDCRAQPGPAPAVSNLIESLEAGNVQNTRATRGQLPLSRTGAREMVDWTYSRKYLLSSKLGWRNQALSTWEKNQGGSRCNLGVPPKEPGKDC